MYLLCRGFTYWQPRQLTRGISCAASRKWWWQIDSWELLPTSTWNEAERKLMLHTFWGEQYPAANFLAVVWQGRPSAITATTLAKETSSFHMMCLHLLTSYSCTIYLQHVSMPVCCTLKTSKNCLKALHMWNRYAADACISYMNSSSNTFTQANKHTVHQQDLESGHYCVAQMHFECLGNWSLQRIPVQTPLQTSCVHNKQFSPKSLCMISTMTTRQW